MIYLRPQKTYRAPAISDGRNENELFPPTDQSRYRVVAEALRGRVLSNDNPQLCFTALFYDARDGSNLTERLRENGFRPGWFLDGKAVDASLITDGGYTLTIGKEQLTNAFVRLTLCARDTDILLALVHPDYRPIYERVIAQGAISSVVIEQSEDLVNQILLDELNKSALTEIKREFTLEINKKADKSELLTPEQIKELAHALDEERKVGGRNLITAESCANRTSDDEYRWLLEAGEYTYIKLCNQRDFPTLKAGEEVTLSILIQCDKSDWNGYEWAIRISDVQGTVKYLEPNNVTQDGFCLHKWTFTIREEGRTPMIELYNHIFRRDDAGNIKYNKRIEAKQIKLERGNVATDWTPAPEDMLAELNKYTTLKQYKTDRAEDSRKLDNKLDKPTSGKYILDIDIPKQFEELVKVGGRNLLLDSKAPRNRKGQYLVYKFATRIYTEGEFVLSFDAETIQKPFGGLMRVLFGHQTAFQKYDSIVWKEGKRHYQIVLNVQKNSNYTGGADSIYIYPNSEYENPQKTPNCGEFTLLNVKLERGNVATDWTPAPEDIQSDIKDLQQSTLTPIEKEWVGKMGSILFPNNDDNPQNKGGLNIDRSVFLRFSNGKPSALIGGQIGSDAVLMAGVQNYGTTNQTERTAIYQDGTAKFGDVNLNDKTITLMPKSGLPLRVTAEEGTFIENFLANSKDDRYIAYERSFVVLGKGEVQTYSFDVANNDTKLTITIPKLTSEVYQINQSVILTLDGVTLGSWHGDTKLIKEDYSGFEGGGVRFRKENTPLVVENLKFERYLNGGSHTLSISVTSTDTKDKATITKLTAHLYYDASQAETILTQKGFRAFGGQNRYFDIDWSWTYRYKGYMTTSNPYIARVKGGMRVDRLTLEQPLDAPGCVLAGGRVEWGGQINNSFGKYKNERGQSNPTAYYNSSRKVFVVNHSIGNTRYVPMITSIAGQWSDLPQVVAVNSNSFEVAFINGNNERNQWGFNYTCFKAD